MIRRLVLETALVAVVVCVWIAAAKGRLDSFRPEPLLVHAGEPGQQPLGALPQDILQRPRIGCDFFCLL